MLRKLSVIFLTAVLLTLSGCVDISNRTGPAVPAVATTPKETTTARDIPDSPVTVSVNTTTEVGTATPEEETTQGTAVSIEEIYSEFQFDDEHYDFLGRCVFVGDSICSGLGHYGIIPMERVIAQGNIAARNIFDFKFAVDGGELTLVSALVNANPEYIVFSMGINDVNITSEQEFTDNYREILQTTEGFLPNAQLIVLSITPIDVESSFTTNESIDNFNSALKKLADENGKWTYIDVTKELKNSENALKSAYSSGDGIHLSPDAYYAVLYQLCQAQSDEVVDETNEAADFNEDIVILE